MNDDELFNNELLDLTVELMFYNENYQTGIVQAYQFLINNSGDIQMYKDTNMFFSSRYSKYYHQKTEGVKGFLIFLDLIYLILLVFVTLKAILTIKLRIMDIFNYKAFTFTWFELLDV